jgi:hypothetical protein
MNSFQIFLIGIITALGALIAQFLLSIVAPEISNFKTFFSLDFYLILAIFLEELFKLVLFWKILNHPQNKKTTYFSAILLGSGFATAEILLNILGAPLFSLVIFFSYLGLFLIHILTLLIYSLYFSQEIKLFSLKTLLFFILGFFIHFLFNFFVVHDISAFLLDITLLFFVIISAKFSFLAKKSKLN